MHIAVCIKYIPDPEAAFSQFSIDEQAKKVVPAPGLRHVVSPFDEQAIEAALRVREQHAGARIEQVSFGGRPVAQQPRALIIRQRPQQGVGRAGVRT